MGEADSHQPKSRFPLVVFMGVAILGGCFIAASISLALQSPHPTRDCADFNSCQPIPADQYWFIVGAFLSVGATLALVGSYLARLEARRRGSSTSPS